MLIKVGFYKLCRGGSKQKKGTIRQRVYEVSFDIKSIKTCLSGLFNIYHYDKLI